MAKRPTANTTRRGAAPRAAATTAAPTYAATCHALLVYAAPAAELIPIRVTPRVVLLGFDRLAEAIRYATDKGCHVISMSLGGVTPSGTLERAVEYAVGPGGVVLAAARHRWPWGWLLYT